MLLLPLGQHTHTNTYTWYDRIDDALLPLYTTSEYHIHPHQNSKHHAYDIYDVII